MKPELLTPLPSCGNHHKHAPGGADGETIRRYQANTEKQRRALAPGGTLDPWERISVVDVDGYPGPVFTEYLHWCMAELNDAIAEIRTPAGYRWALAELHDLARLEGWMKAETECRRDCANRKDNQQ